MIRSLWQPVNVLLLRSSRIWTLILCVIAGSTGEFWLIRSPSMPLSMLPLTLSRRFHLPSSLTLFKPLDWLEVLGFKWSLEISLLLPASSTHRLLPFLPSPSYPAAHLLLICRVCLRVTSRLCQIMIMIIWLDWLLERHDATAGVMEFFWLFCEHIRKLSLKFTPV